MDLRSLCSKLDMDALRAKIPPLPQIKLPKSMSKLRSRKIFRSSREDVNSAPRRASSKRRPNNSESLTLHLGPPSEAINRTPNRISTISSLMNQRGDGSRVSNKWKSKNNDDEEHFYRSAGSIDDYFASPRNPRIDQIISRPISPIRAPPITQEFRTQSEQNIKMSFGERLHKSYKDVTEFKLKHLFAKKTVVRTDKIEINEYIHRFDEDRQHEERVKEKMYRDVAEDYRFQFRVSQQKSEESYAESPASSPIHQRALKKSQKTVSELSGDESGMELSPPPRRPGIASTRFARVRHTPLNMSLEEDNDDGDGIHVVEDKSQPPSQNFKSTRASIKLSQMRHTSVNRSTTESRDEEDNESSDDYELDVKDEYSPKIRPNASSLSANKKQEKPTPEKSSPRKSKSIKERMSRFAKQRSEGDEKKRRAPLTPQQSEENEETTKSDKPFEAIKQNLKRLQKSIKLPQHAQPSADAENENEETNPENKTIFSKTQQFAERLKRFRSTDHIDKNTEEDENKESPIHKISNRLQEWKKSIRKKVDLHNTDNDDDYAGGSPQKPVGALMMKLKHIRSRKHDSVDDPDDDEEGGETYKESLAARAKLQLEKGVVAASQVPQRTIKKISETKKYFRKKHENDVKKSQSEEDDDEEEQVKRSPKPAPKSIPRPPPPRPPSIPRPHFSNSSEEDTDNREAFIAKSITESQLIAVPAARAVWTTRPILSDETTDYDDDLPRILLHQDNSDIFESTLIIAVTRPISRATTPIITELPPDSTEESGETDTKLDTWNPNQEKAETGSEITPPTIRKLSKDSHTTSSSRGHSRKDSIESNSDDSWIKDIPRGPSIAVLNSVSENEEPWRIIQAKPENNLYKTKSIDLFELQKKHGGVLTAFEDFDDELKNTPVVKIANEQPLQQNISLSLDNSERESSEELENPYDDNSSRITEISVHPPNITITENANIESELKPHSFGNSRESLTANLDDKDVIDSSEKNDNEESLDAKEEVFKDIKMQHDRPPSKTPSPPPSKSPTPSTTSKSPTPPPLPQRQPSIRLSKLSQPSLDIVCPSEPPPPLPLTKPPIPPNRPAAPAPKIPDRDPSSTARASRPLVKTASLRLAYSEQVSPQDVGKVNKLISRFEPGGPSQRPRILPRKAWFTSESEEYSDEEDILELLPTKSTEKARDATPTNYPRIQKSFSIDSVNLPNNNENLNPPPSREIQTSLTRKATSQVVLDNSERATPIPSISISSTCLDVNSNFSQPSSVYGSPLPYPASLVGSTEVTPTTIRKESEHLATRRNRRSLVRDDERFYSFDSDEENSYYSISSTNSNRYIVEL